jgi:hypothetical protein
MEKNGSNQGFNQISGNYPASHPRILKHPPWAKNAGISIPGPDTINSGAAH